MAEDSDPDLLEEDDGDIGEAGQEELVVLSAAQGGERLDKWLALQLSERSRSEVQRWIEDGRVLRGSTALKSSYRLAAGDEISVRIPRPVAYHVSPEPIPLDVVYEDDDVLIVNKPAGMVVHPALGNWQGTLVNAVLYHCPGLDGVGGTGRPGIVHRLDKDTSGLILIAKNDRAHRALQAQFKDRTVEKTYLALVYGYVDPRTGTIEAPLGRDPRQRKRMAVVPAARGRAAVTRYETLTHYKTRPQSGRPSEGLTLLACHPLTGRTHQIRVHLAYIKHPIAGDAVYAGRRHLPIHLPRQFLHAARLRFRLPSTGAEVEFTAQMPEDLQAALNALAQEA